MSVYTMFEYTQMCKYIRTIFQSF